MSRSNTKAPKDIYKAAKADFEGATGLDGVWLPLPRPELLITFPEMAEFYSGEIDADFWQKDKRFASSDSERLENIGSKYLLCIKYERTLKYFGRQKHSRLFSKARSLLIALAKPEYKSLAAHLGLDNNIGEWRDPLSILTYFANFLRSRNPRGRKVTPIGLLVSDLQQFRYCKSQTERLTNREIATLLVAWRVFTLPQGWHSVDPLKDAIDQALEKVNSLLRKKKKMRRAV